MLNTDALKNLYAALTGQDSSTITENQMANIIQKIADDYVPPSGSGGADGDAAEFIFDAVFSQMCSSGEVGTLKNTNYDEIISKISAGIPVACRINFGTGDRVDSNNEDYVVKSYGMLLLSNQIEFTMVRVNTLTLPEETVELIRVVIAKRSQTSATIYKKLLCTESLFWKKQIQSIELNTDAGGTIVGGTANLSDGTTVPITVTVAQA